MNENALKKLAKEIADTRPSKRQGKSNRTLSLAEPEFTILQKYCRSKGFKVSSVLDKLIAMFLEEIKDDLTLEHLPDEGKDEDSN